MQIEHGIGEMIVKGQVAVLVEVCIDVFETNIVA